MVYVRLLNLYSNLIMQYEKMYQDSIEVC